MQLVDHHYGTFHRGLATRRQLCRGIAFRAKTNICLVIDIESLIFDIRLGSRFNISNRINGHFAFSTDLDVFRTIYHDTAGTELNFVGILILQQNGFLIVADDYFVIAWCDHGDDFLFIIKFQFKFTASDDRFNEVICGKFIGRF